MSIKSLVFNKIQKTNDNLIGYVSFDWDNDFTFENIGVYKLDNPKSNIKIRLRYSVRSRPKNKIYNEILNDINSYVIGQYGDVL